MQQIYFTRTAQIKRNIYSRMNLLWLNQKTDLNDSGLGVAIDWIEAFSKRVERLFVVTHERGRCPQLPNVEVYSIGKEKAYGKPRRAFELLRQVQTLTKRQRIDGCFVHMVPILGALVAPMLRAKGIPVVQWYAHKHVSLPLRLSYIFSNRIATCSKESLGFRGEKIVAIGHGIDTTLYPPRKLRLFKPDSPLSIVTIGRISPIKRLEVIINAVSILKKKGRNCKLVVVGEARGQGADQYEKKLCRMVDSLDIREQVVFTGPVSRSETPKWYAEADVFVNCSDTDSLDKSVLEAMCSETPVVTSNESFRSILQEICPLSIVPKGRPDKLADAIDSSVINFTQDREILGKLRNYVLEHHSLDTFVEKVLNLITKQEKGLL